MSKGIITYQTRRSTGGSELIKRLIDVHFTLATTQGNQRDDIYLFLL